MKLKIPPKTRITEVEFADGSKKYYPQEFALFDDPIRLILILLVPFDISLVTYRDLQKEPCSSMEAAQEVIDIKIKAELATTFKSKRVIEYPPNK